MQINSINNGYSQNYKNNITSKTKKTSVQNSVSTPNYNNNISFTGMEYFLKDVRKFFTENDDVISQIPRVEEPLNIVPQEQADEILSKGDEQLEKADKISIKSVVIYTQAIELMKKAQDIFKKGQESNFENMQSSNSDSTFTFEKKPVDKVMSVRELNSEGKTILQAEVYPKTGSVKTIKIYDLNSSPSTFDEFNYKNGKLYSATIQNDEESNKSSSIKESYLFKNNSLIQYREDSKTVISQYNTMVRDSVGFEAKFDKGHLINAKENLEVKKGFAYAVATIGSMSFFSDDKLTKYQEQITNASAYNLGANSETATIVNNTYTRTEDNKFIKS